MLRIGFLTEPVLSQILQSLRSFRMTERRVRNDIFSNYDTVSKRTTSKRFVFTPHDLSDHRPWGRRDGKKAKKLVDFFASKGFKYTKTYLIKGGHYV